MGYIEFHFYWKIIVPMPEDNVLLVTYNKTLINYMSYLYSKIENEFSGKKMSLFSLPKDRVKITTVDSLVYWYYLKSCRKKNIEYKTLMDQKIKFTLINDIVSKLNLSQGDTEIVNINNTKFLLEEIDWMKACNIQEEEEYQEINRTGIASDVEGTHRLSKNSSVRKIIYNLKNTYTLELFKIKEIDFNDIRRIALEEIREETKENISRRFTHIIIDESQDLCKLQLEFLKELYLDKPYSSITFLYDSAQSIYSQSWLGNGRNFTSIGFNMIGKSKTLSKNFRTTTQISKAAYSLLNKSRGIVEDENYIKPYLIDKQGTYPIYKRFTGVTAQCEYIKSLIEEKLQKYSKKDICILARGKNNLSSINRELKKIGIDTTIIDRDNNNFDEDIIKLLTLHSVKGMECPVVIIVDLNEGVVPYGKTIDEIDETIEKKLLYVGMTRATQKLYLFSSGVPSKFIDEIDSNYLRIDEKINLSKFQNISIDRYRFKEKISELYSSEEKIRQWIIDELLNKYG